MATWQGTPKLTDASSDWCIVERCNTSDLNKSCTIEPTPNSYCAMIYVFAIPYTNVRIWDLVLLLINVVQLFILVIQLTCTCRNLKKSMALFGILVVLILLIYFTVILTNITEMSISYDNIPYKVLRLLLRCVILITEITVIVFGMFFKRYKDRLFRLVLSFLAIVAISVAFTVGEGVTEFLLQHNLPCDFLNLFTNGGMIFLFSSSIILSLGYFVTYAIYCTRYHYRWDLPSKKSFYRYCLFLSLVNLVQAIASMLWYNGNVHQIVGEFGICLIALTQFIYMTTFAPMIYWIFLSRFFKASKKSKQQLSSKEDTPLVDDDDDSNSFVKMGRKRFFSQSSNHSTVPNTGPVKTSLLSQSLSSQNLLIASSSSYGTMEEHGSGSECEELNIQ